MRNKLVLLLIVLSVGCSTNNEEHIVKTNDPVAVKRGKYLVEGLAACGQCHGGKLSGGKTLQDLYGEIEAPNITPHETGIGSWSAADTVKVLRGGNNPDDKQISTAMHVGYEWLSDVDALAIVSYLSTLQPISNEVEKREVGFIKRNTTGFLDVQREVTGFVPEIPINNSAAYGQYLVDHVARCSSCHNSDSTLVGAGEYLVGGKTIKRESGEKVAPNITTSEEYGIGSWSDQEILAYLKTGRAPDGSVANPDFCPIGYFRNANDQDLGAIVTYLRKVK